MTLQTDDSSVAQKQPEGNIAEPGDTHLEQSQVQPDPNQTQTIQLHQTADGDGKVTAVNQVVLRQLIELSEQVTDPETGQQQIQQVNWTQVTGCLV